mmetsp:Transcript_31744/g.46190  ORF Transcript_31744/g.46190 Transcript_31744/m.46190 type:complete len:81 (+) Transcript_31744:148-390(+)
MNGRNPMLVKKLMAYERMANSSLYLDILGKIFPKRFVFAPSLVSPLFIRTLNQKQLLQFLYNSKGLRNLLYQYLKETARG